MFHRLMLATAATSLLALTACGGDDDSAGDKDKYCEMSADDSLDPSENPELFAEFISVAPAEIRDEVELVADLTEEYLALESADEVDEDAAAALEERYASDEVQAAFEKLDAYDVDECGIDRDS